MITKIKYKSHEEWLSIRARYIGGSDAGAVVGMNPYKGPFQLWLEKTGQAEEFTGSIATETGTLLEPYVAELFTRETGKKVRRDNFTMVNDLYPWACANVDRRIVGENAILECKTTNSFGNMKKFKQGEYPESWYCQMTHYLAVTGCERAYLAIVAGGREFKMFTLERDEDEIQALMDAERAFWECVTEKRPPVPMASDSEAVKEYYPEEEDIEIDLTGESDILSEYETAKADEKLIKERLKELQTRICAALGERSRGANEVYKVRWSEQSRETFDHKALRAAHPELDLTPFIKVSSSRVFRFDRKKTKEA